MLTHCCEYQLLMLVCGAVGEPVEINGLNNNNNNNHHKKGELVFVCFAVKLTDCFFPCMI